MSSRLPSPRQILAALLFSSLAIGQEVRADWPQLRGPSSDGHSPTPLPLQWSEATHVTWKVAVPGRGFSSPVVLDGRIWLTTALEDSRSLRVLAFEAASGKILHNVELFQPDAWQSSHAENSYASPTPVLEEGRVYVHFGAYGTAALDSTDGRVLWTTIDPLRVEHEVGPGSSPLLYEDLLVFNCDGTDERFVAALQKDTGELVWKTPRSVDLQKKGSHLKAFSTPLVVPYQGRDQLISPGAGQVSAYDPHNGKELWHVRYEGYSNVPQPVAGRGRAYITTGYMKPLLLAVHLGGAGDVTEERVEWSYRWQVPANPSPLLIGERLYMISDHGNATWLDVRAGEDLWRQRLGGRYYASPIFAEGRIYNFSTQGKTVVIDASDDFRILATNEVEGSIRATPAASGGALFLRTEDALYRIENPPSPND